MKTLRFILPALLIFGLFACESKFEGMPNEKYDFYITGIRQSLDYTFNAGGRSEAVPDEVKELTVLILNDQGRIVYEQYYFNYDYYMDPTLGNMPGDTLDAGEVIMFDQTIPDTLFIPPLPAGKYDIIAATAPIYRYYLVDPYMGPDGTMPPIPEWQGYPRIDPSTVSMSPIYVGKSIIALTDEKMEVAMNMRNVSAKITLVQKASANNLHGGVDLMFGTQNNSYFSFEKDSLLDQETDYDAPIYTYLWNQESVNFYVLPKSLTSVAISYYDYTIYENNFRLELPIDPPIVLRANDAVTFTIDVDKLFEGAGRGILNWQDIEWNNVGEVTIP